MSFDWKGLLNWSTKFSSGETEKNRGEDFEKRKEFLKNAIKQYFESTPNPEDLIAESIEKVNDSNSTDEDKKLAMDVIAECLETNPELNRILDKSAVIPVLLKCANGESVQLAEQSLMILAESFANNLPVQLHAHQQGATDVLIKLWFKTKVDALKASTLTAIGCLIRNSNVEEDFKKLGGLAVIADALKSSSKKVEEKGIMFLKYFLSLKKITLDELNQHDFINSIVKLLESMSPKDGTKRCELIAETTVEVVTNFKSELGGVLEKIAACSKSCIKNLSTEGEDYSFAIECLSVAAAVSTLSTKRMARSINFL